MSLQPDETGPDREQRRTAFGRSRWALFAGTGLALPFFAFPPFSLLGKPVDLATIVAGLFILVSLPSLRSVGSSRLVRFYFLGALIVPLLALVPPRPAFFEPSQFALSYGHWLLMTLFFLCSLTLAPPEGSLRPLLIANVSLGVLIAAFGLYQSYGWSRQWPGTQWILLPFQREPFRLALIGEHLRPTSIFLEPAWLAGYLAWIVGLALALLMAARRGRAWILAAVALLAAALLSTLSWGGYADLLAVLVGVVFAVRPTKTALRKGLVWGFAGLAVLLAFLFFAPAAHRMVEVASARLQLLRTTLAERSEAPTGMADSAWVRYRGVQRSLQFLAQHPVCGIGLGQYEGAAQAAGQPAGFANPWCGWLAIASEMGVLGPVLLLGALLPGFRRMRRLSPGSGRRAGAAACLAFALVAQLHTGSFADLWWWFPVALAAVISVPSSSGPAAMAGSRGEG